MYNEQIEELISAALADGVLTEKEKQILFKKAQGMGIDLDEFEMVLDARLVELQKAEKEKTEKSAPKSTKYGDVRKCPVCGALVPSLSGTCPECGYEFSGVDANLSSNKLAEKIDSILKEANKQKNALKHSGKLSTKKEEGESRSALDKACDDIDFDADDQIRNAISNFSIPNTKNDLFEFITSLQSRSDSEYRDEYYQKLCEAYTKAEKLFANDPIFKNILDERKAKQNQAEQQYQKDKIKFGIKKAIGAVLGLVLIYVIWHFLSWWAIWKILLLIVVLPIFIVIFFLDDAEKEKV